MSSFIFEYKAFLNKAAGDGGILNREELIGILERMDKGNNKPVDDNTHDDGNHNDGDGDGNNVRPSCNVVVDETTVDTSGAFSFNKQHRF